MAWRGCRIFGFALLQGRPYKGHLSPRGEEAQKGVISMVNSAAYSAANRYPPTVTAISAARYACKMSAWALPHFDLHRILYIASIIFAGRTNGGQMVSEAFEAWDYGPILKSLYQRLKSFGNDRINVDVFPDADGIGTYEYTCI